MEGSEIISRLASKTTQGTAVEVVRGNIYERLEEHLVKHQPQVVFLDADHRKSSITYCMDRILTHCPKITCIVIHDIYWSQDMSEAWVDCLKNPDFTLTIDLFQAGIIFPNYSMEKLQRIYWTKLETALDKN